MLLVSLLLAQVSCAKVYVWEDADGQTHYADRAESNADVKELTLTQHHTYYAIKKVFDGDTIKLQDGRKIRFLGINTPEVAHSNHYAQAGGEAAKQWLIKQLKGQKVRLEFDAEKKDKYKRTLAHLFTESGVHLNHELVRLGLASVSVFPPNLNYIPELLTAQDEAEQNNRGIWKDKAYAAKPATDLSAHNKNGWQRIVMTVSAIKKTRKSIYLKWNKHFIVRIEKHHAQYFDDIDSLKGQKIEVRGWVRKYKKGYSMQLKHGGLLKRL